MHEPMRNGCLALTAITLLFAGCDATGLDVRSQLEAQLRTQESAWLEKGATTYTMGIERACVCTDPYDVELEVVDGEIVSGVHVFTGEPLTPAELAEQLSLPDLFDVVQDALDRRVPGLSVDYNPDFGYVQHLYVDYDGRTADDDVEFTVTEYTPAAPP